MSCPPQALPETVPHDLSESEISFYPSDSMDMKKELIPDSCMEQSISPNKASFADIIYKQDTSCTESMDMLSWTQKHPQNWSTLEVLDWLYYVAEAQQLDVAKLRGEKFQTVTGKELCEMTLSTFMERDPEYGQLFYDMFRRLINDARFISPQNVEYNADQTSQYSDLVNVLLNNSPTAESEMEIADETSRMLDTNIDLMTVFDQQGTQKVKIGEEWYDIDEDLSKFDEFPIEISNNTWTDPGYISADSDASSDISPNNQSLSSVFSDEEMECTVPKKKTVVRKRNSSSVSNDSGIHELEQEEKKPTKCNRGRKVGQSSKGNHLWEFIRDLLKDSSFNPTLLRWEDKETGVFRFVQSEAVAQMWGRKKNNTSMTYEKLSRAMRFCRSAGYFADVPKNGKFPKKLCFRFGHKAYGWKDL